MENTQEILNRIINKGGLIGFAAKMYINDEEQAEQFIRECAEQCHNKSAKNLWGEELVLDIMSHTQELVKKQSELILQE